MSAKNKPTHELPGGQREDKKDDGVVNDSLGTIDPADATGTGDDEDNSDAEKDNANTRKD